jgi:hypothetical protein
MNETGKRFSFTRAASSTSGRARNQIPTSNVIIERMDGRREEWPAPDPARTSMDCAVTEVVDWLEHKQPFPCAPEEAVQTLEAIAAFHVSHSRNAAWTDLPLTGKDRETELQTA